MFSSDIFLVDKFSLTNVVDSIDFSVMDDSKVKAFFVCFKKWINLLQLGEGGRELYERKSVRGWGRHGAGGKIVVYRKLERV